MDELEAEWDELIERLEIWEEAKQLVIPNTYAFLIECCRLAEGVIPGPALEALEVSERYCAGRATKRELLDAKGACAEVAHWSPTQQDDYPGWAARAVYCCLSPTFDPEGAVGCIRWCWDFLEMAGVRDESILRVGKRHFQGEPPVPETSLTRWKRFVQRLGETRR